MSSKLKYDIFSYRLCRVFVCWLLTFPKASYLIPIERYVLCPPRWSVWCLSITTLSSEISLNPYNYEGLLGQTPDFGVSGNRKPPITFLLSSSHWFLENCRRCTSRELAYFESFYGCYIFHCFFGLQER